MSNMAIPLAVSVMHFCGVRNELVHVHMNTCMFSQILDVLIAAPLILCDRK